MINFKKIFFFVVKPPNPVEHEFDGSSKELIITDKLKTIFKEIFFEKNNISYKVLKIFSLGKNIFFILLIPIYFFPAILLKIFSIKLYNINYWQIGTYVQQFDLMNKLNDRKLKIVCCIPSNHSSSNFFDEIVKSKFFIINNYIICLFMIPFYYFKFLRIDDIKTDEGYKNNKCFSLFHKFDSKNLYLSNISKIKFNEKIENEINSYGKNYCIIHVRNLGTIRDSKIDDYFLTVDYLNKIGFKVIRFCENFSNINEKWKLNYYHEILLDNTTKKLQFKLISNAKFMISNNSGPANIATILKVPLLLVNAFPYNKIFNYNDKDMTLPKRIIRNNQQLDIEDILQNDFSHAGSEKFYNSQNYKIKNNTPEEILRATKEMILNLESNVKNFKYSKEDFKQYYDIGKGNLSNIF